MQATTQNDLSIPAASAAGSEIDIEQLFRQHRQHLLFFVKRYLRSDDDAEDVVQNTFIEAMRCGHRFAGLSKPSTWLFGIALNLARNQVRRNSADLYEVVDDVFMEQLPAPHADPAEALETRQMAACVDQLLGSLAPRIRATFVAVLDGDTTYDQAARDLAIPIGTVRSRVSRVRAAMRAQFGHAG